jgi:hypothetical protein
MRLCNIQVLFLILGWAGLAANLNVARADEPPKADKSHGSSGLVSLILTNASAERRRIDTVLSCEAVIENGTGKTLSLTYDYQSAFDLIEVVATTKDGKELIQQAYSFHLAPNYPARNFELKPGRITRTLSFTVVGIPNDLNSVNIRLVGTLPGCEYKRILSTETKEVEIRPKR